VVWDKDPDPFEHNRRFQKEHHEAVGD
jgi:hypothetical protein